MFKLVIADDEGKTTVVPLVRDEITIGRREGNTIRLTERNISRKHAKLRRANGSFVLEDLQSFNGVKVNGKKIGAETKLAAGDQILIGDYQLALQIEATDNSATLPEQTAPSPQPMAAEAVTAMIPAPMPMAGPPARLVMMSPPAPGAEYALSREKRMRIGRAEDLEIWVNHRSISREHAEVVHEDGVMRIKDMGSANGLRVNGQDTRNHVLQPGDVVELGQVRFRYVPAGEAFTFDEGRTIQMEALPGPPPKEGGNRTTMIVAGAILSLAVIAGAVIALSGSPDGPTVTSIGPLPSTTVATPVPSVPVPVPTAPVPVVPTGPALDVQIATETAACQTSINSGNFPDALAHAAAALALRPDDAAAAACLDRATQEQTQSGAFASGLAQLRNGELESAYLSFESLPVDSTYRQRPEVVDTMNRFATDTVTQAEALVSSNPTEATRLAEAVLNMVQAPPATTERAQDVMRRTRATHVASVRPQRVHTPPAPSRTPSPPPSHTTAPTPPPPTPTPPPPSTAPPSDDRLQQCILNGDNRCIITMLGGGRAHGTTQLRALFSAQRETGDRTGACTTARQLTSAAGVPAAQLSMIRQYVSTQCH